MLKADSKFITLNKENILFARLKLVSTDSNLLPFAWVDQMVRKWESIDEIMLRLHVQNN